MIRPAAIFLLLVACVMQACPLRVCAVEQSVTGTSCHQQDFPAGASTAPHADSAQNGQLDGHAGDGGHHDSACQCEAPKDELARSVPVVIVHDLQLLDAVWLDFRLSLVDTLLLPAADPPDALPVAITLPLLN